MILKKIYQELVLIRKELQVIRSILEFNKEYVNVLKARHMPPYNEKIKKKTTSHKIRDSYERIADLEVQVQGQQESKIDVDKVANRLRIDLLELT